MVSDVMTEEKSLKKVSLFYFSGTGNTRYLAEKIAANFEKNNLICQAISIETLSAKDAELCIHQSDMIGFAYPIYGSDIPVPMKEFMQQLQQTPFRKTFVVCTQMMFSGDGARIAKEFLNDERFHIMWGDHFNLPNNISIPQTAWFMPYTNDPVKISKIIEKADKQVERFVSGILSGKPYYKGFTVFSKLLGSMQRIPYRLMFPKLQNDVGIDDSTCIHCSLCEANCPVGNLSYTDGKWTTKGNCVLCVRCYDSCPVAAVTYKKKKHNHKYGMPYRGIKL